MKILIVALLIAMMFAGVLSTGVRTVSAVPITINGVIEAGEWDPYFLGTLVTTTGQGGMSVNVYGFADSTYLYAAYVADTTQQGWTDGSESLCIGPNLDYWTPSTAVWPERGYTHIGVPGDGFAQSDGSDWVWPDGYGNTDPSVFTSRGIELVVGLPCYTSNPNVVEIKIPLSLLEYAGTDGKIGLSGQYWQYTFADPLYVQLPLPNLRSIKQDVHDELVTLRGTIADKGDGYKLDEAAGHLTKSLDPTLWVDGAHINPKRGDRVFNEEKDAVAKLVELIKDKKSTLTASQLAMLQDFINRLVNADRSLASIAISDAAGGKPKQLQEANRELAKGDILSTSKYADAIEHYRNAWQHAQEAVKPIH